MDGTRFDAFTRILSSRRTALGGLLGGLTALLGLALPEDAAAHDFRARCRKIQDPPRRRACLRRARAHNRAHARTCQPLSPAVVCPADPRHCAGVADGCGGLVTCPCPAGESCIGTWHDIISGAYTGSCCPTAQVCPFPRSSSLCCSADTYCVGLIGCFPRE